MEFVMWFLCIAFWVVVLSPFVGAEVIAVVTLVLYFFYDQYQTGRHNAAMREAEERADRNHGQGF